MKTTLDLPDELLREVELRADVQQRQVKDLVAEFIRQGLGMPSRGGGAGKRPSFSARVQMGENGLPVVQCASDAPATQMSAVELLALEQAALTEEDLRRAGLSL